MDHSLPLDMYDDVDTFLDMDAPYIYDEPEQYLDTTSSSESTSPVMSSFDMTLVNDFNGLDQGIYPSPMSSSRDTASPQPLSDDKTAPAKAPAKRKRENRYKNAPRRFFRAAVHKTERRNGRTESAKDQRIKDLEVMLAEQKQKNDSLSQAYSSLHAEYAKLRGEQARAQQAPRQRAAPPMAYDASSVAAHMGIPTHPGAMNFADNMFMFQDMQNYTL